MQSHLFFLRFAVYLYAPISFFPSLLRPYQYICTYIHIYLIYAYVFGWFLFFPSPMIAREGHKISRTYILYLYYRAPLQGEDKMSNRSSGTLYAYIDDQYNTLTKEKARREKKKEKKMRETNCEKTGLYVYLDLSNKRNVLIGWTEKRHKRERKIPLNFSLCSFSFLFIVCAFRMARKYHHLI